MIFHANKDTLTIELHGKEQFFAIKAKVVVAKADISHIEYLSSFHDWRKWEVRMPGAGIPKYLMAGSFWTEEGWDFLYVNKPSKFLNPTVSNVLYIETTQNRYRRLIISCPREDADKLIAWSKQK